MSDSLDDREAQKGLWYWRLINADVLLLLVCYMLRGEIFEGMLIKAKTVVVIILAILAFLGLVKRSVLTEGFTSISNLLASRYARFTISMGSIAVVLFTLFAVFSPETFSANLAITASFSYPLKQSSAVAGDLAVYSCTKGHSDSLLLRRSVTLSADALIEPGLAPGIEYRVSFLPSDTMGFDSPDQYLKAGTGETPIVIPLRLKYYRTIFRLTPDNAVFSFGRSHATEDTLRDHKSWRTLGRGQYFYRLDAGGFVSGTGTFKIPEDIPVTVGLVRKTFRIAFVADRGLKGKFIGIPGTVTVRDDSTSIERKVHTGESVTLEVGKTYGIHVVAMDPWDLLRRRYVHDAPFALPGDSTRSPIVLKVTEE